MFSWIAASLYKRNSFILMAIILLLQTYCTSTNKLLSISPIHCIILSKRLKYIILPGKIYFPFIAYSKEIRCIVKRVPKERCCN
jgi:hypothetical protein